MCFVYVSKQMGKWPLRANDIKEKLKDLFGENNIKLEGFYDN